VKSYPLFKAHVDASLAAARIVDVFESGYINEGEQVTQLTSALSRRLQASNLVLVNSCTSALFLALKLAGVGPGDEVISTPMTCVATNAAIAMTGAKIVWADVDPRHGMMNGSHICEKVTERTKAVVAVAWAGCPPNMFVLKTTCKALNLKLILDAAHAFGAEYAGLPIHESADFTCYSFQAIKHFTTGDGGAIVCSSAADFKRAKALKWFGLDRDVAKDSQGNWKGQQWDVDINELGYKLNMNNLAAAVGLSQIPHIDSILQTHCYNAHVYDELFAECQQVVPNVRPEMAKSSHWVYAMSVNLQKSKLTRDELLVALNAEGIMAGVVHVPNDTYACFTDISAQLQGVRVFAEKQFNLPCGWWLEDADISHIASRVKELTK
jgi:perosamine synthetase